MGSPYGRPAEPIPAIDYDERIHAVYARGRQQSPATLQRWLDAFAAQAPGARRVLDLGCGIGRFTPGLARTFAGPVVGVEPSTRMRAVAARDAHAAGVTYVGGRAEALPLADRSCDAVLLYLVWHHVVDRERAAAELARVVRPGGVVLVRSNFADRMPDLDWFRFFPSAREVDRAMYEPLATVLDRFTGAGFGSWRLERVAYEEAPSRTEQLARLRTGALSTIARLPPDELAPGFAALEADVAAGPDGPVLSVADLLVVTR
jgi:ubiquinone/menaquinone biosynthesis C-methylase UbiE